MPQLLELLSILFETDAKKVSDQISVLDKSLENVAKQAGVSVKEAGAFNELITGLGTDAQQAARLLTSFSDTNIDFSNIIGQIAALQDEFKLIPTDVEALDVGKSLGFDEDTVKLLRGGRENIEGIIKRITEAQTPVGGLSAEFGTLFKRVGAVSAAVAAAGTILFSALGSAKPTDELGKLSTLLGENVEDVDGWSKAVEAAGGDAGAFLGSLENINTALTKLTFEGDPALLIGLNRIGIDARNANEELKTAVELLPELADAFAKVPNEDVIAIGERLGIDKGTLLLLKEGGESTAQLLALISDLGVVTQEQAAVAREYEKQWFLLGIQFDTISRELGTALLPILTDTLAFLRQFVTFLRENEAFTTTFFVGMATAITAVFLPAITSAGAAILVFLAPAALVVAKLAAITAVVAGVSFVVNDLIKYLNGGEAAFSSFYDEVAAAIEGVGGSVEYLGALLRGAFDIIVALKDLLVEAFTDPTQAVADFETKVAEVFKTISNATKEVKEDLEAIGKLFGDLADFDAFEYGRMLGDKAREALSDLFGSGEGEASPSSYRPGPLAEAGRMALGNVAAVGGINFAESAASLTRGGDTITKMNIERLEVVTQAKDAAGISGAIGKTLTNQLEQVTNQVDDGLRA